MRSSPAVLGTIAAVLLMLPARGEVGQDGPDGLPSEYADKYFVAQQTRSPDGRMAVIYPTRDAAAKLNDEQIKNYLVALKPFRILATLPTGLPYFEDRNHASPPKAAWSRHNSVALVTNNGRWGPNDILLYELRNGEVVRSTNLLEKIHALLVPDFNRAKVPGYNDFVDFVFSDESGDQCTLEDATRVRITAMATTDPKEIPGIQAWDATLKGYWNIPQAKFTYIKIIRKFAGVRPRRRGD